MVRVALLGVLLLGLLGMHGLGAAPTAGPLTTHGSMTAGVGMPGSQHSDLPGPAGNHDHVGPVCQASAVSVGAWAAAPTLPAVIVTASGMSPLTASVAADAAAGTGCGPPSLTALSISRT